MRFEKALEGMREEYDYKKKLRLFELDMLKKGHKFMNIPDAIAPELRDECYSSDKDNFFKQNDLADGLSAGRFYYVRKKKGKIVIRQAHLYSCLKTEKAIPFVDFDDNDIEKVLAPVPNYEEVKEFVEEDEKLKELLKKCQKFILDLFGLPYGFKQDISAKELLTKINEVLK